MLAVSGVQPQHVTVTAHPGGVARRAAQSLTPVGRQPFDMLRMQARVGEDSGPRRPVTATPARPAVRGRRR